MNILVVTNDGVNITSPLSNKFHYLMFELDTKEVNLQSQTISELVSKTKQIGLLKKDTNIQKILNSINKKPVYISHTSSPQILKRLQDEGVEMYFTFKKSIKEALCQYYSDRFINDSLYTNNLGRKYHGKIDG